MEKQVRFGDLVRNSGRPQVLTLWTAPEKDRTASRALKENRVLTVMEPPGTAPKPQNSKFVESIHEEGLTRSISNVPFRRNSQPPGTPGSQSSST